MNPAEMPSRRRMDNRQVAVSVASSPKVVVAGASGFVGRALVPHLWEKGYSVVTLDRKGPSSPFAQSVLWDGQRIGDWQNELEASAAVINLAGASISLPWNPKNKELILRSRVDSSTVIGAAIKSCSQPPHVWINASATGYYGNRGSEVLNEDSAPGQGFLSEVCRDWETAVLADEAFPTVTRRVVLRFGLVLAAEGGPLKPLAALARLGLGGAVGHGDQWVSWISRTDLCRLIEWSISTPVEGVLNATAPNPVTNAGLMADLRKVLGRHWRPPSVPRVAMKLMSLLGGPDDSLLLDSARALPTRALSAGFQFEEGELAICLQSALRRP